MMTLSLISLSAYGAVLVRLLVALLCGALIGMERGSSKHDAGLRTHIIVCIGAASVMIISQLIADKYGSITDITRLGAQVISGIGFLGAGSIMVSKNRVRGLTTAAGLWTTACLGLVAGAGFIEVSLTILVLIMFTTYILRPLSLKLQTNDMSFEVAASGSEISVSDLTKTLIEKGCDITSLKTANDKIILVIHTGYVEDKNTFIFEVSSIHGVIGVTAL